jgi:shikimate kinase
MGSGKTAVGEALSKVLNRPFYDLDQLIESQENMTIERIFNQKGEIFFRKREAEILRSFLATETPFVLSLGGGTPCYAGNMDYLLDFPELRTIYLKTSLATIVQRLWEARATRPLIAHLDKIEQLEDFVRKHLFERGPVYLRAHWLIDADGLSPGDVAKQIVLKLF